jgi:hypothetical protein
MFQHLIILTLTITALSACTPQPLKGYGDKAGYLSELKIKNNDFAKDMVEAASNKPALKFPARFGVVRLDYSSSRYHDDSLTTIPDTELATLQALAAEHRSRLGTFEIVPTQIIRASLTRSNNSLSTLQHARLAAAGLKLDALVFYEFNIKRREGGLWLADLLTLYILPTRTLENDSTAIGTVIDVASGLPIAYAQTNASASTSSRPGTTYQNFSLIENKANVEALKLLVPALESQLLDAALAKPK